MPHEIDNLLLGHLIIGLASLHASLLNLQPYHKSISFPTPPFKIRVHQLMVSHLENFGRRFWKNINSLPTVS